MCAVEASVDLDFQEILRGIHYCVPRQGDEQNSARLAGLLLLFGSWVASEVVMV